MLRARTSLRSSFSSRATRSISRSMANTACGRPAPRTTVVGTRLVSATVRLDAVGRHHVGAGERGRRDERHDDAPRQVGAGVVQHGAAQAEDFAVAVDRDRDLPVLVALLRRRQEMLAAVLLPFHRPAELDGGGRDHRLLRIERRLGAEAAADERRDHADRFRGRARAGRRACRGRGAASGSTTTPSACRTPGRGSPARRGPPASWRRRGAGTAPPRTRAARS